MFVDQIMRLQFPAYGGRVPLMPQPLESSAFPRKMAFLGLTTAILGMGRAIPPRCHELKVSLYLQLPYPWDCLDWDRV
jgi:hypothetical protein